MNIERFLTAPRVIGTVGGLAIFLALHACSSPAVTDASIVPKPKVYGCDFAMKLAPQLEAAPPELKQFALDAERMRYELAAARGEPDPHCQP